MIEFPAHPAFRPHIRIVTGRDGAVLLRSCDGSLELPRGLFGDLVPLIQSARSTRAIVRQLASRHTEAAIYFALAELFDRGCIGERRAGETPRAARGVHAALECSINVQLSVLDEDAASPIVGALHRCGVGVSDSGSLHVVLTSAYLHRRLAAINARAQREGEAWLPIRVTGMGAWIGPLFAPDSCCWECFAARYRLRHDWDRELSVADRKRRAGPVPFDVDALESTASRIAGLLRRPSRSVLRRGVVVVNAATTSFHPAPRIGSCPACGGLPIRRRRSSPTETRQLARSPSRPESPREFLRRRADLVGPLTGLVGKLTDVDILRGPLFVSLAAGLADLRPGVGFDDHGVPSCGKGTDLWQARAGALGEAIERRCLTFRGDEPRLQASYVELGDAAIHPNDCMHFSERQYVERRRINRSASAAEYVPRRFDERRVVEWSAVIGLEDGSTRYVPSAMVLLGYPVSRRGAACVASSNGCAAGPSHDWALLSALNELIERDAVAIWWYNRVRRPAVDIGAYPPWAESLARQYASINRQFWVLDLTTDLGVPVCAAVSRRTSGEREDIVFGFGAAVHLEQAAAKAIAEMHQLTVSAETMPMNTTGRFAEWLARATTAEHAYLAPDRSASVMPTCRSRCAPGNIDYELAACRAALRDRNVEVFIHPHTREDIAVPVLRAIAPALRFYAPRFAPGRLYDVPVACGWRKRRLPEHQMNGIPVFS